MKSRKADIAVFSLSLTALAISLNLLARYGAYEIEYGGGAVVVDGGWPMIAMNIIRLIALFALCVIVGIRLFKSFRKTN